MKKDQGKTYTQKLSVGTADHVSEGYAPQFPAWFYHIFVSFHFTTWLCNYKELCIFLQEKKGPYAEMNFPYLIFASFFP